MNRPSITGPSLLKNKSFIYTHKNEGKENYLSRPSHGCFKGPHLYTEETSIDSLDRRSEDISISIGSSNGDNSFFNSSKLEDSLNLKDSCNSGGKMDRTLNFSRKSNQTIYKGDNNKNKNDHEITKLGEVPSLCSMARELQSSFESDKSNGEAVPKKSFENASINFSKKFQNYRKPKENL